MLHYLNYKDSKKRKLFFKKEFFINLFKSCSCDSRLLYKTRFLLKSKIFYSSLKISKFNLIRIRNRCVFTGRTRFVFRRFCLARMPIKFMISKGYGSGFRHF